MLFFALSSGVQINGGSFYDVAGDMNVESAHPTGLGQLYNNPGALEFLSTQDTVRRLSGPDRNGRRGAGSRMLLYGVL